MFIYWQDHFRYSFVCSELGRFPIISDSVSVYVKCSETSCRSTSHTSNGSHLLLALTLLETMGMSFELNRMRYPATCGLPMSGPAVLCKLHKRTNLLSSTRGHLLMDTSSQGSRGSNHSTAAAYLALLVLSVPHLRYDRLKWSTWKVINAFFIYLDGE